MLIVTNTFVVIMWNSFYCLSQKRSVWVPSQNTISTCVMYYFKFEQELSALIKMLTEWSLART